MADKRPLSCRDDQGELEDGVPASKRPRISLPPPPLMDRDEDDDGLEFVYDDDDDDPGDFDDDNGNGNGNGYGNHDESNLVRENNRDDNKDDDFEEVTVPLDWRDFDNTEPEPAPAPSNRENEDDDEDDFEDVVDEEEEMLPDPAIAMPRPGLHAATDALAEYDPYASLLSTLQGPPPEETVVIEFEQPVDPSLAAQARPRRTIRKADRSHRLTVHRVHVLSLLATGQLAHAISTRAVVRAAALSAIPTAVTDAASTDGTTKTSMRLNPILRWMKRSWTADLWLPLVTDPHPGVVSHDEQCAVGQVLDGFANGVGHPSTLTVMAAAVLRALGIPHRLIVALDPIPLSFQGDARPLPSELKDPSSFEPAPPPSLLGARETLAHSAPPQYPCGLAIEVPLAATGSWSPLALDWRALHGQAPTPPTRNKNSAPLPPWTLLELSACRARWEPAYIVALDPATPLRFRDVTVRYRTGRPGGRLVEDKRRRVPLDDSWWTRVCHGTQTRNEFGSSAANLDHALAAVAATASGEDVQQESGDPVVDEGQVLLEQLLTAPFPTRFADYKDHRLYALERHLKQAEVIHPREPVLGKLKGEPIYPRAHVQPLKSRDGWLKSDGRVIKENEIGVRQTKARKGGEPQPLYGAWQTEYFCSEPIDPETGEVPVNKFGNVELFHPRMLPRGGAHLQFPRAKQLARQLGIPYGEALVGFEFQTKSGRPMPILDGIIVAAGSAQLLCEAHENRVVAEREQDERDRKQAIITRWERFARGLLIRADRGSDI
ncbi:hypothetical protein BC828DRAFT_407149 [Blastocladiella britannica]|nr:hypothetical protein BC828DRAFT_407149 [Blastocladiella britannica]